MKRIVSLVLVMCMITFSPCVFAEQEAKEEKYCDEAAFLENLGITGKGFANVEAVTRGDFVKIVVNLLYPDMVFESTKAFADVDASHKNSAYISAAKSLGIVKGNSNSSFYPDREITVNEAVAVAVNAVGYTLQAEAYGGYPTGYLMCARLNRLTVGTELSSSADGVFVSKLLYNMLFMCPNDVESIDSDGIRLTESRENLLERVYGIKKYDGILWDNGITSLSGEENSDTERCVINCNGNYIAAFIGKTDIYNHLGNRLNVFIKYNEQSGKSEVVNYSLNRNSDEYIINADRIISINEKGIEYEETRDSEKTNKISFGNEYPVAVLNGVIFGGYTFDKLVPENGFVRVAINSGKASCIEVISFKKEVTDSVTANIITDSFSKEDGYINCRLSPANTLNFETSDTVRFILNDKITDFSEIGKNTVISVARSEKKKNGGYIYFLAASDETVTGVVESASEDDKTLTVNGNIYEVSDNLLSVKKGFIKNMSFENEITFCMDIMGNIAYAPVGAFAAKNYAFLINSKVKSTYESVLLIKLLTKDGEVKTYENASKIQIDGKEYTDMTKAQEKLVERPEGSRNKADSGRAVIVEFDSEGRIRKIDTDTPNLPNTGEINLYSSHSHIRYSNEEVELKEALKAGYRNPRIGYMHLGKNYTVDARFYINSDTVILAVPGIDMYGLDVWPQYASNNASQYKLTPEEKIVKDYELPIEDKYYRLYDLSSFNSLYAYDIQGYDIDPDTGFAGLVVLRGRTDVYWYGKVPYTNNYPMSVFLRKSEYYDSEMDKNVTRIYYTSDGYTESSATIDTDITYSVYKYMIEGSRASENPYGADVPALKCGDIIRVVAKDGKIGHLERVFKIDELNSSVASKGYPLIGYAPYSKSTIYTTIPYDERNGYAQFTGNYIISVGYIRNASSGNINLMAGKSTVADTNPSDPMTYAEHNYNIGGMIPITISINNGETKVRKGDISDIRTVDSVNGDLSEASVVIVKSTAFAPDSVIIVNR